MWHERKLFPLKPNLWEGQSTSTMHEACWMLMIQLNVSAQVHHIRSQDFILKSAIWNKRWEMERWTIIIKNKSLSENCGWLHYVTSIAFLFFKRTTLGKCDGNQQNTEMFYYSYDCLIHIPCKYVKIWFIMMCCQPSVQQAAWHSLHCANPK